MSHTSVNLINEGEWDKLKPARELYMREKGMMKSQTGCSRDSRQGIPGWAGLGESKCDISRICCGLISV